jgi:6-phosphogluconolactonase
MLKRFSIVAGTCALLSLLTIDARFCAGAENSPQEYLVYIGTYTGPKSKGIYAYRLDMKTGALTSLGLAAQTPNPTFLAIHPNHKSLYAANEIGKFEGKSSGAVSAFSIESDSGKLTLLNQKPSGGGGPCHVAVDQSGQVVLVANYGGGSIASFPVKAGGALGDAATFIQHQGSSTNPQRQEGPHAHCIGVAPNNGNVLATDLGLDKILIYKLNATSGTLTPNDPPFATISAGSGPRHFAFTPNGRYCYVINEMSSTLTSFAYSAQTASLKELQTVSTHPGDPDPRNSTAEIEVHPSGRFVYGSNRGHDSIAVFAVNEQTGKLTLVEHQPTGGKVPRSFGIDPTGEFLLAANQNSDNVVVFRIDGASGRLTRTSHEVQVGAPVCVKFVRLN